jgi:transcriptional regulator with XRE-family HTH domain
MTLRITAARNKEGWSRAALARHAEMSASTIGLIESGRFSPYPAQLVKIASALGLPEEQANTLLEEVTVNAD